MLLLVTPNSCILDVSYFSIDLLLQYLNATVQYNCDNQNDTTQAHSFKLKKPEAQMTCRRHLFFSANNQCLELSPRIYCVGAITKCVKSET